MNYRRYPRLLLHFWKTALIQAMSYRTSFFLSILANALDFSIGLLQYLLFFTVARNIAGWTMPQMLGFYAVFMTAFSLQFIFLYPNLADLNHLVNSGQLDLVLTKPASAQVLLSFRRLSFEEFGSFFASQVLLGYLVFTGRILVTPGLIGAFAVAMLCSLVIVYSLFLALMSVTIWLEKLENSAELIWTFFGLCRYPVDVFPRWLRTLFFTAFPVAFVCTVPAQVLLGAASITLMLECLACALLSFVFSRYLWIRALAGYSSAGG